MSPFQLVKLSAVMERTSGNAGMTIGLIDGPVASQHPELASENIIQNTAGIEARFGWQDSAALLHGTFIAGILSARRKSSAEGICPACKLLIRPVFIDTASGQGHLPSATPTELAAALFECIESGARVINLSLALASHSLQGEPALERALDQALNRHVLIVAAAGNQGVLGSSAITRHPWVIPVTACDLGGRPLGESNLGISIGRRGLSAPGDGITSLAPDDQFLSFRGTSVAVPFVTGAIALLWSEFPMASAAQVKLAITHPTTLRRASVVPPLLDAAASYQTLSSVPDQKFVASSRRTSDRSAR